MSAKPPQQEGTGALSEMEIERNKAKEKKRTRRDSANRSREEKADPHAANGQIAVNGSVKRGGKVGDRKSRTIYGRGLPKKGGGGGKGTWGKLGEEVFTEGPVDDRDPNYDSEEQDNDITYKSITPEWNQKEIVQTLEPIIQEYFEHGQQEEVCESLKGINVAGRKHLVVVILISLSMEKKNEFRELASNLIKRLIRPKQENAAGEITTPNGTYYGTEEDLKEAFLMLCDNLLDLVLDTPDAAKILGKFMARAIAESLVDKDILEIILKAAAQNNDEYGTNCAREAKLLLSIPHYDLGHIWGVGGGNQPMVLLKKKIELLLKEYLSSGDSEEAICCITDLDVPHFNHEVVYEAIIMVIELNNERSANMMVHLFKRLADTAVATADQLNHGFRRIYTEMPEISIDVPNAYAQLDNFVGKCHDLKIVNSRLVVEAPNRSRKRFVSEGDGGRLKNRQDRFFDIA